MKLPAELEDLPYFKIFNEKERIASRACAGYKCAVCGEIAFYADILNLQDHPQLLDLFSVVCPTCRKKYNASYQKKREIHFGNKDIKTADKKR